MGEQQGRMVRGSIRLVRPMLRQLEAFRLQKPAWLPFAAYVWMAERKSRSFLEPPLAARHPAMLERLRGISSGSSVGLPTLLLSNALESSLSSLGDCTVSLGGCSAVAVRGERSENGQPVIAKNFDYLPLVQPFYILRRNRPTTGLASLEFTMAPFAGAIDGVNEAGLCITYNYAFTMDEPPTPSPPLSVLIGEALNQCANVAEAIDWITSRARWGSGMLMLADADGDVASLEISSTAHGVRRLPVDQDCLFHTNRFHTEEMQSVQLPGDTVYTDRAPAPQRGNRLHQSSEERESRFSQLLTAPQVHSLDDLSRVMSDHGPANEPGDYTICVHGAYWFTTASLQLLPQSREMRVSFSTTCEADYTTFSV